MTERQELHIMLDRVNDEDLDDARQILRTFLDARDNRTRDRKMTEEEFQAYLDNAPEEDEELSEEELLGIEEGRRAIREGRVVPFDQVAEELGI